MISSIQLVIPRKYPTELLDIAKVTLHNIPALIQLLIILPRLLAVALRRDRRNHATLFRHRTTLITLISLVHHQRFALVNLLRNLHYQLLIFRIIACRSR